MLEGVLSKLVFVVIGAALTWIFQQYRIMRGEDTALLNEHIKDVEKFRDAAQDYWLKKYSTIEEDNAAAAKVRASHAATTLVYVEISRICGHFSSDYKILHIELFECATGGNFESVRPDIDTLRAIDVYDRATQLIHVLRSARRNINSLKALMQIEFISRSKNCLMKYFFIVKNKIQILLEKYRS